MGKKTNYKKLWRNSKTKIITLSKDNDDLQTIIESYQRLLVSLKEGEISLDELQEETLGKKSKE